MFSSRLFWRIFLAQLVVIFCCTLGLATLMLRGHRETVLTQFESRLTEASDFLVLITREAMSQAVSGKNPLEAPANRDAATDSDNDSQSVGDQAEGSGSNGEVAQGELNALLAVQAERWQARMHLFDVRGQVVATSQGEADRERISLEPGLAYLQSAEVPFRRTVTRPDGTRLEVRILPIQRSGKLLGYLQLEAHRAEVEAQLASDVRLAWLSASGICLIGMVLSVLLAARISRPLEELTQAAQSITIGNLYQTVPVNSADELGTLARTFNSMSSELSTRIKELQQQGQQLRANSERLATVLGGMVEGVIAVDSGERILFANEAAFRMIEFDGRRVIGRPYWEVLRNTDVQSVVRDVLAGEFQLKREIELPRSHNRIAFIASRLPGDPCPGVVLVLHDVTELRRLERIRSEFVSNVGHELKTPLAAIQACTDTLLDGALQDPVHADNFLNQISEHADRLHKLIIDLMELAKIESEDDVFHAEVIDIGIPIQEAIDEHYSISRARQVELASHASIEEVLVLADLDGVRTIINNLLDNAINYTPPGGRVHVEWGEQQGEVLIRVADTGIGIERSHIERIFERFYRVDSARSRDAGGTGLGLAIVKHLCQHFSGSIQVESEPDQGTTFTIRFPSHPNPRA